MTEQPILTLEGVHSGYGRVEVLRGIDLRVGRGEVVAVIGSNGAGKSTLLKTIVGLVHTTKGSIALEGVQVVGSTPEKLVRSGVALVPEGRLLFGTMTVRENLELGAYAIAGRERKRALSAGLERVTSLFPVLGQRAGQPAETLSGGEQQMLAVGRALMCEPRMLLLDEPSLGLAPRVIAEIFAALDALRAQGVTVLLVEQDARLALKHADRGYVMRTGRIAAEGSSADLLANDDVRMIYLGSWHGEDE
jgi:branched-chain amino acid transport system ATP-binding protein